MVRGVEEESCAAVERGDQLLPGACVRCECEV